MGHEDADNWTGAGAIETMEIMGIAPEILEIAKDLEEHGIVIFLNEFLETMLGKKWQPDPLFLEFLTEDLASRNDMKKVVLSSLDETMTLNDVISEMHTATLRGRLGYYIFQNGNPEILQSFEAWKQQKEKGISAPTQS